MSEISFKQSLELLERNHQPKRKSAKQTKKFKNPFLREPSPPRVTLSSIIKSKKKNKLLDKPTPKSFRPKNTATAQKQIKSKVDENVMKLLRLSGPGNLDNESAQKLFKRAQTQKYVIPEAKSNVEQKTAFTDEDFRKFEREYFCS